MSANVVHAKLAFEVKVSDFLATPSFYRNKTVPKMFLIIIKGLRSNLLRNTQKNPNESFDSFEP